MQKDSAQASNDFCQFWLETAGIMANGDAIDPDLIEEARSLTEPCPVCGAPLTEDHEAADHEDGWGHDAFPASENASEKD